MAYAAWRSFVRGVLAATVLAAVGVFAQADEAGFEPLFDGKSLAGWKPSENVQSWKVENGEIVCHGPRSHLFYVGPSEAHPAEFKDFHFKADVMTKPGSNTTPVMRFIIRTCG